MIFFEVNIMENLSNMPENVQEQGYTPRPAWQGWAARFGLVLFLIVVVLYYLNMFRGGL